MQIVSKKSVLFTFVVDPGRNGRNSTYGIILRNWAEVSQNAEGVSVYKISIEDFPQNVFQLSRFWKIK